MRDPQTLYTTDEDVAAELADDAPVLVHLLRGFVDAGGAGQVAAEHLLERFDPKRLVTFDIDQLLDYRSRRPLMTFDRSTWTDYDTPELAIELMRDRDGTPFLLLHGAEPDLHWEAWIAAVREVVERFGVRLVVGAHGIPMGVPHTRPLGVTAHATRPDLVAEHTPWFAGVRVPASAGALLEHRLGRWGYDAMGFAVHVPHYLAQSTYPQAAMTGLGQIERAAGLDLASGALEPAARQATDEIEAQMTDEVAAVVSGLERQHDAAVRAIGSGLHAEDIPSADELGAQFERFLAQQADDES